MMNRLGALRTMGSVRWIALILPCSPDGGNENLTAHPRIPEIRGRAVRFSRRLSVALGGTTPQRSRR